MQKAAITPAQGQNAMLFVYFWYTLNPRGYAARHGKAAHRAGRQGKAASDGGARQAGQAGKGSGAGLPQRGGVFAGEIVAEGLPGIAAVYAPVFEVCLAAMTRGAKRLK